MIDHYDNSGNPPLKKRGRIVASRPAGVPTSTAWQSVYTSIPDAGTNRK